GGTSGSPHIIGDYNVPLTHEVQIGLDHELLPNFGVSGTFTWRHFNNFNWRNNGLDGRDYAQMGGCEGTDPVVGSFSVPVCPQTPRCPGARRARPTGRAPSVSSPRPPSVCGPPGWRVSPPRPTATPSTSTRRRRTPIRRAARRAVSSRVSWSCVRARAAAR